MHIFFSVGEPSGDLHGANLVREITRRDPQATCVGYGGPRMQRAGLELHEDLTQFAIMWFWRVLLNVHRFWGLLWRADRYFRQRRPDAVVLIDYPGFNWWIARRARRHGIPVFYYGAPQMWAWASWRIHKMRRLVDHVLCKLPFEATWYQERGCRASYVGHPYFDELSAHRSDPAFLNQMQQQAGPLVVILPGSRTQEVLANTETFLKVARVVARAKPEVRFAVAAFNTRQADFVRTLIEDDQRAITVHVGRTADLIQCSTACMACSGSVSLELLYFTRPSVIHYKVGRVPFLIQRFFRKVRYITLVNLLASENRYCERGELYDPEFETVPFPEYLTCQDRSETIAAHLIQWLTDESARAAVITDLQQLKQRVAAPGATSRAADYILQQLTATSPQKMRSDAAA